MPGFCCLAVLLLTAFTAMAEESPIYADDANTFGRLVRVVRPEYPPDAVRRHLSGVVDVEGIVDGSGAMSDVTYKASSSEARIFVAALESAVPYWEFNPPRGKDCFPSAQKVGVRVEFQMDGDEPRMFVTHAKSSRGTDVATSPTHMVPVKKVNPTYPRVALRRSAEARVYSRQEVDANGKVTRVETKTYLRPLVLAQTAKLGTHLPSKPESWAANDDLGDFSAAVERALSEWVYSAAPEGMTRTRIACQAVHFKLK